MTDNQQNTPQDLDDIDNTIINMVTLNPEYSNNKIANNLVKLGKAQSHNLVYQRLKRNDYLMTEVTKLRERIREDHTRTIFPLAQQRMKKALKDKQLDHKTAFPYVKLAYDKQLEDSSVEQVKQHVSIDKMQVILQQALGD